MWQIMYLQCRYLYVCADICGYVQALQVCVSTCRYITKFVQNAKKSVYMHKPRWLSGTWYHLWSWKQVFELQKRKSAFAAVSVHFCCLDWRPNLPSTNRHFFLCMSAGIDIILTNTCTYLHIHAYTCTYIHHSSHTYAYMQILSTCRYVRVLHVCVSMIRYACICMYCMYLYVLQVGVSIKSSVCIAGMCQYYMYCQYFSICMYCTYLVLPWQWWWLAA